MMLEFLGHPDAAHAVVGAIERLLADPSAPRTGDIGGRATTVEVGRAIAALL
jgi:tartrate dehydrogenase/decarboxylase/D-malate dehydrogenase